MPQKHEVDAQLDRRKAEREFVKAHGTDNQCERWMAGLLPEDELLAIVRAAAFRPFSEFLRWKKLEASDVRHERDCSGPDVRFVTDEPGSLTHDEWAQFKKITLAISRANNGPLDKLGVKAIVTLVEHIGRCNNCAAEAFGRAANIRIEWLGRPLSREYTLEAQ